MKKTVIISIQGKQADPEGAEEGIELVTRGSLCGDETQGYRLTYQESELTGLEGTTTTFCIASDQITMLRTGNLNSEMRFQEGQKHLSVYQTPFGELMVGVNTQKARAKMGESGGRIDLRYVVEIDDAMVGTNTFHIQVKEPDEPTI
jgi:uncharacterized beta-barrel protein YwiB (DUF1934 family)